MSREILSQTGKGVSWLANLVIQESGEEINRCYQCQKCSAGCPISFAMDILPHQIIRMLQFGLDERVLTSKTIWLCASCETCTTRCPNEIDLAKVMDALRQIAERSGVNLGEKDISLFNSAFLASIKKRGRVHELEMIRKYTLKRGHFLEKFKSGELIRDVRLGWEMFKRGKLRLLPQKMRGKSEVRGLFKRAKGEGR